MWEHCESPYYWGFRVRGREGESVGVWLRVYICVCGVGPVEDGCRGVMHVFCVYADTLLAYMNKGNYSHT